MCRSDDNKEDGTVFLLSGSDGKIHLYGRVRDLHQICSEKM